MKWRQKWIQNIVSSWIFWTNWWRSHWNQRVRLREILDRICVDFEVEAHLSFLVLKWEWESLSELRNGSLWRRALEDLVCLCRGEASMRINSEGLVQCPCIRTPNRGPSAFLFSFRILYWPSQPREQQWMLHSWWKSHTNQGRNQIYQAHSFPQYHPSFHTVSGVMGGDVGIVLPTTLKMTVIFSSSNGTFRIELIT